MSDCRFGVSPVNYLDPDPDVRGMVEIVRGYCYLEYHPSTEVRGSGKEL